VVARRSLTWASPSVVCSLVLSAADDETVAAAGGTAVGLAVGPGESVDPQLQATAQGLCGGANASRKCIHYVYDHADRYSHLDMRTRLVMLVSGRPGGAVTFTTGTARARHALDSWR